jgi:hypothetical protein
MQKSPSTKVADCLLFFALLAQVILSASTSTAHSIHEISIRTKIESTIFTGILREVALESQLAQCRIQLGPLNPVVAYRCHRATQSFRKAFDFEASTHGVLTFSRAARELLNSGVAARYLEDLSKAVKPEASSNVPQLPQDLWNWTLAHPLVKNSPESALKLIAVLLQDPKSTGYVSVLKERSKHSDEEKSINLLYELHSKFEPLLSSPSGLGLETEDINKKNLYHFYVIAFGAYRMTKASGNPAFGFLMPFLLNRTYELGSIRAREAISYLSENSTDPRFQPEYILTFLDPPNAKSNDLVRNFQSDHIANSLEDIYLGYRGAVFGAGLAQGKTLPTLNRIEFEHAFRHSPFHLTNLIFQSIQSTL